MNVSSNNWCTLPTTMGDFRMYDTGDESVRVVCFGELDDQGPHPLLRMHSSCLASEVFGAVDCDCADQLREAMKLIAMEGRGLIVHLHQEGRGQGLTNKITAVRTMQRDGLDTVEAFTSLGLTQDTRSYEPVVALLRTLAIERVRLISNNPAKIRFLAERGVTVESVSTHPTVRPENAEYLLTKNAKLGHRLPMEPGDSAAGPVHFYHSDQPWGALSNFSRHAVFVEGRVWPTVEHYYQAQKFAAPSERERIRCCATPMLAKSRANDRADAHARADWTTFRETAMLNGLRAKFQQHPDLRTKLLSSNERPIVERTANDTYWGDGGDGSGENRLGCLLVQVRTELRNAVNSASHTH
jgi:GTP cyclohydrolase II